MHQLELIGDQKELLRYRGYMCREYIIQKMYPVALECCLKALEIEMAIGEAKRKSPNAYRT